MAIDGQDHVEAMWVSGNSKSELRQGIVAYRCGNKIQQVRDHLRLSRRCESLRQSVGQVL
jgi:hypothetical protein